MTDYLKQVEEKEGELGELRARMDADKELAQLAKYVMKNAKSQAVADVVNVTLNKPAVFAANVESALNNAVEQVNVETEDKKVNKDHIADCVRAGFASANGRLRAQGKWPLNAFIDQQMCRRGRGAARVLFRIAETKDGGGKRKRGLKADITPWDTRFMAYDTGEEGLSWAAYRTVRSKGDITAEWPEAEDRIKNNTEEIIDYWNGEVNAVYAGREQIFEQANPYGYPPVCVQTVTLGSMTADADSLKHQGESIFFLIRDCIPELNRLLSIMQTLNMLAVKPPKGWASRDGKQEAPEYKDLMAAGSITEHESGGGATNIDFGDLRNSAVYALNVIDSAIKQGSLEVVDMGSLPGPMSAVALIEIGEGRDQVFLPRLAARGLLNQQIADMFLRQITSCGERRVELGTSGRQRTFDAGKLKGAYEVVFKYFVKSPKIDVARYSMAQVAKTIGLPQEDIDRDVLQLEDPDGVRRRRSYETAEKLSPLVRARRIIKDLTDMEDDDANLDAEILAMQFDVDIKNLRKSDGQTLQQLHSIKSEQAETPPMGAQNLLPLLAQRNAAQTEPLKPEAPENGGEGA